MKRISITILAISLLVPAMLQASRTVAIIEQYGGLPRWSNTRGLAVDDNGIIHLIYDKIDYEGNLYEVYYLHSTDGGYTWDPRLIDDEGGAITMDVNKHTGTPYIVYRANPHTIWSNDRTSIFPGLEGTAPGHTSLAVNPDAGGNGYGILCSGKVVETFPPPSTIYLQLFDLATLEAPSGWEVQPTDVDGPWKQSCTWLGNDAIVAGLRNTDQSTQVWRRLDRNPWDNRPYTPDIWYSGEGSSVYKDAGTIPSMTTIGEKLFLVYFQEEGYHDYSIRFRITSTPNYEFEPAEDGYLITDFGGAYDHSAQIADGFPFVVWRYSDPSSQVQDKIYFSYTQCDETSQWPPVWTPPARLTDTGDDVLEVTPHVAMDWRNGKVYVIWKQYDPSMEDNYTIQIQDLSFDELGIDPLRITRPAGGETWWCGDVEMIKWIRGRPDIPNTTFLYYTVDGWETWQTIDVLQNYAAEQYPWTVSFYGPRLFSNNCYVKIVMNYEGGAANQDQDISGRFTILIKTPTQEGGEQSSDVTTSTFLMYSTSPSMVGSEARVRFSVPYNVKVNLEVYDVCGHKVTNLMDSEVDAGTHTVQWNGKDHAERQCPAGIYFVRMKTENYYLSKKLILVD